MKKDIQKKLKYYKKQLEKKGLDYEKVLDGKSEEQISKNIKTFENFKKRYKRAIERPKIIKEVEEIDKRLKGNILKEIMKLSKEQIKSSNITSKTKNIIMKKEYNKYFPQFMDFDNITKSKELRKVRDKLKKVKSLDDEVELYTKVKATDFFFTYFKELTLNAVERERLENISNAFGNRLDILRDSIDDVLNRIMVLDMSDTEDVLRVHGEEGLESEMKLRLDMFEIHLKNKYGIDIIDYSHNKKISK